MTIKHRFRVLAILWTMGIMLACWIPVHFEIPPRSPLGWQSFLPDLDKMVHLGLFLIFATLWFVALDRRWRPGRILLGGIALATVTELVQSIPAIGRSCDFDDAVYDVIGVVTALAIMSVIQVIYERPHRMGETSA